MGTAEMLDKDLAPGLNQFFELDFSRQMLPVLLRRFLEEVPPKPLFALT